LKHGLAARRGGIEPLLMQEQVDAERVQLAEEADQVLEAAAETINRPGHNDIELPPAGIAAHRVA
jgi:hypothetical protein